jgi:plastocyanin
MPVYAQGVATFKEVATGNVHKVNSQVLQWECEAIGNERQMGPEVEHTAEHEVIPGCTVKWTIWEYPQGAENQQITQVPDGLELIQNINYAIHPEMQ